MSQTDYRPTDKIVGIILAVYASCGMLCGGLVAFGSGLFAAVGASQARGTAGEAAPFAFLGGLGMLAGLIIAATYVLVLAGALGVMKSARWGFTLTAILTGLSGLAGLTGAAGFLNVVPDLAACTYCILRLNGTLAPKPE